MGSRKAEEISERLAGSLLDDGQGWRDLIYVDVGVQDSEHEFRSNTNSVCGRIELVQEALIPRVDGVLKDISDRL